MAHSSKKYCFKMATQEGTCQDYSWVPSSERNLSYTLQHSSLIYHLYFLGLLIAKKMQIAKMPLLRQFSGNVFSFNGVHMNCLCDEGERVLHNPPNNTVLIERRGPEELAKWLSMSHHNRIFMSQSFKGWYSMTKLFPATMDSYWFRKIVQMCKMH